MTREQQEHAGGQRQGASASRSPEVPDPALDSEQGPPEAGAFQSKSFQEQEPPVSIRRPLPSGPEDAQEANLWRTQNHAVLKASWIQASAGIEVKYGEGGTPYKHYIYG